MPELADTTKPLCDLLHSKNQWVWDQPQQSAFHITKTILSSTPVLCLDDLSFPTKVSANASSYGLGAAFLQKQTNGQWKLVAYSSQAMTSIEQRYVQIKHEALAVAWVCKRFTNLGMEKTTALSNLTPQTLATRLRLVIAGSPSNGVWKFSLHRSLLSQHASFYNVPVNSPQTCKEVSLVLGGLEKIFVRVMKWGSY